MEKKIPLAVGGIILVMIVIVIGAVLSDSTPLPVGEAKKIVAERSENMLFEKNIVRIPAVGTIIPPAVDNNGTITAGVSVDSDRLNFGRIQSNLSGITRLMNITYPFRTGSVKICVIAQGGIQPFLETPDREFVMSSGEKKEVQVRFSGGAIGNFTGEVDVLAKKPKYGFLEPLLPWVAC
jgi:hypothetical protein